MNTTTTTTTINVQRNPIHLELLKSLQLELADRFLRYTVKSGIMTVFYRTRGNYFVKALYNDKGELFKRHYYHNWNEFAGKPFNYMFSRPALTSKP